MRRTRLLLFVLVLSLAALPVFASGRATPAVKAPSLFAWVWQTLGRIVPALDEGRGTLDPDGGDGSSTSPAPEDGTDGRWTIDPNGSDPKG